MSELFLGVDVEGIDDEVVGVTVDADVVLVCGSLSFFADFSRIVVGLLLLSFIFLGGGCC